MQLRDYSKVIPVPDGLGDYKYKVKAENLEIGELCLLLGHFWKPTPADGLFCRVEPKWGESNYPWFERVEHIDEKDSTFNRGWFFDDVLTDHEVYAEMWDYYEFNEDGSWARRRLVPRLVSEIVEVREVKCG